MDSLYRFEKTEPGEKWDLFVEASVNGTIFSMSVYLESLNQPYALYYCYKKEELRGAVALMETKDKTSAVLHDYVIYNGIMYAPPTNGQNKSQIHSEHFKISSFIAETLISFYQKVELRLHPSVKDIRSFLWVNYGTELPKYYPEIRYTSYIDLTNFLKIEKPEEVPIFREFSSARRQEVRYAIRKGVKTIEEFDPELFLEFYSKTMRRQEVEAKNEVLDEMKQLIVNLYNKKMGNMFVSYTAKGKPGSMAFFCYDNKRVYYLFGANDPDLRSEHTGSAILWDAFFSLAKTGLRELDLEGINSPNRGWFKLSFGGNILPYYQICKKGKHNVI